MSSSATVCESKRKKTYSDGADAVANEDAEKREEADVREGGIGDGRPRERESHAEPFRHRKRDWGGKDGPGLNGKMDCESEGI